MAWAFSSVPPFKRNVVMPVARKEWLQMLAGSPNPQPRALGYVGNSAGAYAVTCLALDLPESCAVATIAGFGMPEALLETDRPMLGHLSFTSFVNGDDPATEPAERFQAELGARGGILPIQAGAGGHAFEDYVANGAVRKAFAWVLKRLP